MKERASVCVCVVGAIVRHHCHALPHVNITRGIDVCETMANCGAELKILDGEGLELLLPSCERSGIHFWSSLARCPHMSTQNQMKHCIHFLVSHLHW